MFLIFWFTSGSIASVILILYSIYKLKMDITIKELIYQLLIIIGGFVSFIIVLSIVVINFLIESNILKKIKNILNIIIFKAK